MQCVLTQMAQAMLGYVRYFLLQLFDGRMHKQKVCQQVQRKRCAFHHCLKDV